MIGNQTIKSFLYDLAMMHYIYLKCAEACCHDFYFLFLLYHYCKFGSFAFLQESTHPSECQKVKFINSLQGKSKINCNRCTWVDLSSRIPVTNAEGKDFFNYKFLLLCSLSLSGMNDNNEDELVYQTFVWMIGCCVHSKEIL